MGRDVERITKCESCKKGEIMWKLIIVPIFVFCAGCSGGELTLQEKEEALRAEIARTIMVHASELREEFKVNEIRAEQKYEGKILHVTGVVNTIGEDFLGDGYVTFQGSELFNVQAMFDDKSDLVTLEPDQFITVVCQEISGGNVMGVILRKCRLK